MEGNLELKDIKLIINRLMSFIVMEGKHFVSEEEKESYVKGYLNLFVKIINEPEDNKKASKAAVMDHIFKDIKKYID